MQDPGLAKAIAAAGDQVRLALRLGLTKQAINKWDKVPHTRVIDVERVTGVPREDLRPDLYPRKRKKA